MEQNEKMNALRLMIAPDEEDYAILLFYLDQARSVILNRLYPYGREEEFADREVPERFVQKQIRIAAYLLNKRGAEGQTQHSENGVHRYYTAADVPEDLLADIPPFVGIV